LVKSNWTNIRDTEDIPTGIQFASNLKKLKKNLVIPWEKVKQKTEEHELQNIEEQLRLIQEDPEAGFMSDLAHENLKNMEARRRILLAEQEETWRLKSRAIWLENGDENTKFFKPMQKGGKQKTPYGV
jgi:hypothetical protein